MLYKSADGDGTLVLGPSNNCCYSLQDCFEKLDLKPNIDTSEEFEYQLEKKTWYCSESSAAVITVAQGRQPGTVQRAAS